MERLTYDFCLGDIHCWQVKGADNQECRQVCEEQEYGCKGCPIALAFDRLAAYENTGLTPEEVQQTRWISVEEKLPEKSGEYLVFTEESDIFGIEFDEYVGENGEFGWWYPCFSQGLYVESDWQKAENVTHWMPLPQPPKEETDG